MQSQEEGDTAYLSYMLRMWRRRDSNGDAVWCASLEEPGKRHTESFGEISAMFLFLQKRLDDEVHGRGQQEQE